MSDTTLPRASDDRPSIICDHCGGIYLRGDEHVCHALIVERIKKLEERVNLMTNYVYPFGEPK